MRITRPRLLHHAVLDRLSLLLNRRRREPDFMTQMSGLFNRFSAKKVEYDVEECIVDAENAAEIASCREQ